MTVNYDTIIRTENQYVGGEDYLRLEIAFTHTVESATIIPDEEVSAEEVGVKVLDWGRLSWKYDIEDFLMVPGVANMTIGDIQRYIYELLFYNDEVNRRAKVRIFKNGSLLFSGKLVEDAIEYDDAKRTLEVQVASGLDELNKILVYDEDGNPLNPLGYDLGSNKARFLDDFIRDIYKKINPNISLEFKHTWTFCGQKNSSPSDFRVFDIKIDEILQGIDDIYNDSSVGVSSLGGVLKLLAQEWASFTGLLHDDKAFFAKMFFYDPSNMQEIGKVNARKTSNKHLTLEYVKVKDRNGNVYKAGDDVGIDDKRLIRDKTLSLFYAANLNCGAPAGSNVYAKLYRANYYVFYDIWDTGYDVGDRYTNNGSTFEVVTWVLPYLTMKRIDGSNEPESSGDLVLASGNGPDTLSYDNFFELYDKYFTVYKAKDEYSGLGWSDFGQLTANFWYKYRGDVKYCRVDTFDVSGINYDLLKCFEYNGEIFQPISLTLNLADYSSKIDAIYLGEAPE